SGTSAQLSLYLAAEAPGVWNAFVNTQGCAAPCSQWPVFPGAAAQNGSDGVADFVANDAFGSGAIGYVEAGYAFGRAFPIVRLQNNSGNFAPSDVSSTNGPQVFSEDVATALQHATLNANLTQNLNGVYNAPEANAYPMSSYSYMLVPTTGFPPSKGFVLGTWILYIACGGQQEATPLGYSPLPPNPVQDVFHVEREMPGAPAPPPLDNVHCPNPTITNGPGTPPPTGNPAVNGTGSGGSHSGGGSSGGSTTVTVVKPTPAATANGSGALSGTVTLSNGTTVETLTTAQQQSLALAAWEAVGNAGRQSQLPLALVTAGIFVIVFGPMLGRRVSRHEVGSHD
ncbi:MAG: substrate-binding domain-containing protein, partial [Candidatus Dormibacteraeota bacterium]|nr:substrate-binding domain-containing protein [Candidatus Dormibacteraeota bacterium]